MTLRTLTSAPIALAVARTRTQWYTNIRGGKGACAAGSGATTLIDRSGQCSGQCSGQKFSDANGLIASHNATTLFCAFLVCVCACARMRARNMALWRCGVVALSYLIEKIVEVSTTLPTTVAATGVVALWLVVVSISQPVETNKIFGGNGVLA